MLISTTAVGLRLFCHKMFAIFIFIAHRSFDITELLLTTFVCTHVFQKILIYLTTVVSNLFSSCLTLRPSVAYCQYFFFCFLYHMKFINMHV